MKRMIRFHKAYLPATIVSIVILCAGIVGLLTKGLNLGVDFQAGINQYVQLAYPAGSMTYAGTGAPVLTVTDAKATVVFSAAELEARTLSYDLRTVGTMADLAGAMAADGIIFQPKDGGVSADLLVPTYQGDFILGATPTLLHRLPRDASERYGSIADVRESLSAIEAVTVQELGADGSGQYIIRVRDDSSDADFSKKVPGIVRGALNAKFGPDSAVIMKTDYVSAGLSSNMAGKSVWLIGATLALIMLYSAIRFKIEFAIGVVLAIIHDALVMMAFMVFSGMEFSTLSIAALLTILGYSTNDTIVIFDRVRELRPLKPTASITTVLDEAVSWSLGRTFITTIAT
ncbi:MAG TPA: protein translocase subunit SecF, partial [Spirochaetales bacterium]|nr:protein translocase subunit SecF [Spirochaetales bacterium]